MFAKIIWFIHRFVLVVALTSPMLLFDKSCHFWIYAKCLCFCSVRGSFGYLQFAFIFFLFFSHQRGWMTLFSFQMSYLFPVSCEIFCALILCISRPHKPALRLALSFYVFNLSSWRREIERKKRSSFDRRKKKNNRKNCPFSISVWVFFR